MVNDFQRELIKTIKSQDCCLSVPASVRLFSSAQTTWVWGEETKKKKKKKTHADETSLFSSINFLNLDVYQSILSLNNR